jgi:hypothetical protein
MTKGWSALLSSHLTMNDRSFPVVGPGGKLLGVVVRDAVNDRFVAWASKKRLGDFALKHEAVTAVHAAKKAKKTGPVESIVVDKRRPT